MFAPTLRSSKVKASTQVLKSLPGGAEILQTGALDERRVSGRVVCARHRESALSAIAFDQRIFIVGCVLLNKSKTHAKTIAGIIAVGVEGGCLSNQRSSCEVPDPAVVVESQIQVEAISSGQADDRHNVVVALAAGNDIRATLRTTADTIG